MMRTLAFLLCLFVAIHARAGVTPKAPFGDAVSVMDTIPDEWEAEIEACTFTTDLSTQFDEAVEKACQSVGTASRVSIPAGCYYLSGNNWSLPADGGVGCRGLQIIGGDSGMRGNNVPTIIAAGDRVGTANRDALIYVFDLDYFSIQNLAFNYNNTYGDGIRLEVCRFCTVANLYSTGVKGAPWTRASSNLTTNIITVTDMASEFVVGDRVEFIADDDGGALPGGLSANTPYWIITKSGSNFTVSTTPGGGTRDITTSVSNFFMIGRTITYSSSAIDTGTDTWTIANHGLTDGMKMEWELGPTNPTVDGLQLTGRKLWVINSTPSTFQFSEEPGGTPVNVTNAGGSNQTITRSYAHVTGGSQLYADFYGNRIVDDDARCLSWAVANVFDNSGSFYGANGSDIHNNNFNCAVQLSGDLNFHDNRIEGAYGKPIKGALEISDTAGLKTSIADTYFEATDPGPNSYTAISLSGAATPTGLVSNNRVYGPSESHLNSICIRYVNLPLSGSFINNLCRGTYYCFSDQGYGAVESGSLSTTSLIAGNWCSTAGVEGLPAITSVTAGSSTRPAIIVNHPANRGHSVSGGFWAEPTLDGNNLTNVDIREGTFWHLRGSWAIATTSNADKIGTRQKFFAATAGSSLDAAFATPWNQSCEFRAGETFGANTDKDAVETLEYRMGQVMQHVGPLTGQTADIGTTAIFGGNITAGMYRVECYLRVTTAGTGGTIDLDLTWNDGTASRTESVINDLSLTATNYADASTVVETNGSSDISYAATRSGVTGSPVYAVRCSVAMLQ